MPTYQNHRNALSTACFIPKLVVWAGDVPRMYGARETTADGGDEMMEDEGG